MICGKPANTQLATAKAVRNCRWIKNQKTSWAVDKVVLRTFILFVHRQLSKLAVDNDQTTPIYLILCIKTQIATSGKSVVTNLVK